MYIKIFITINLITFLLYGIDKFKATQKRRRIRESVLITPAYLFGSIGAMLGMIVFNHKTSKTKFKILIPLSFFENLLMLYVLLPYLS